MKNIFILLFVLLFYNSLSAQENNETFYLLFEFMNVAEENISDYYEIEDFWSEIHKQRVADKNIVGWDLWSLNPSGSEQGAQFMTTTLFASLEAMLAGIPNDKFGDYLKRAHPGMSDKELDQMFKKVSKSRTIAQKVYCKHINGVGGTDKMKVGTLMKFDVMKQTDSSYPVMEDQIFKPWHQQEVNEGKKMNWGLVEVLLPMGSTAYSSHITYSMYNTTKQLANSMESWNGEIDLKTELTIQDGLKTRDWKEVKVARLEMMVR